MKKIISIVLIFAVFINFSGCKLGSGKSSSVPGENFEMKSAEAVVNTYMGFLDKGDYESAKKLYSSKLLKQVTTDKESNLRVKGYNITEKLQTADSGEFKVDASRMDFNKPAASLDEYTIKVIKEKHAYKIDSIKNETQKEGYFENEEIRMRNKNQVKNFLVIDSESLPQYTFSKSDKINIEKIKVPRSGLWLMNFSYTGDYIAFSVYNKNNYFAVASIDESLAVQGGDNGGGQGGAGTQQGGNEQGQVKIKEKPIGKEIAAFDMLKDCKIDYMVFSPDEKFIAVQYTDSTNTQSIKVYSIENGDIIPFKFDENYNLGVVNIVLETFDNEKMNYEVVPKQGKAEEAKNVEGKWQLDLKSFKAKMK